jgi:hypothetical protein
MKKQIEITIFIGTLLIILVLVSSCYYNYSKYLSTDPLPDIANWPETARTMIIEHKLDSNNNGKIDTGKELLLTAKELERHQLGDYQEFHNAPIKSPEISYKYLQSIFDPMFDLTDFKIFPHNKQNTFKIDTDKNVVNIIFTRQPETINFTNIDCCDIVIPQDARRMRILILNNTMSLNPNFFAIYLNFDKKKPNPPYDYPNDYTYANYLINDSIRTGMYFSYWITEEMIKKGILNLTAAFGDLSNIEDGSKLSFSIYFSK